MNRRDDKSIKYDEPDKEFKKTKKKNVLPLISSSPKCEYEIHKFTGT